MPDIAAGIGAAISEDVKPPRARVAAGAVHVSFGPIARSPSISAGRAVTDHLEADTGDLKSARRVDLRNVVGDTAALYITDGAALQASGMEVFVHPCIVPGGIITVGEFGREIAGHQGFKCLVDGGERNVRDLRPNGREHLIRRRVLRSPTEVSVNGCPLLGEALTVQFENASERLVDRFDVRIRERAHSGSFRGKLHPTAAGRLPATKVTVVAICS